MSKDKIEIPEKISFQLVRSDNGSAVFERVVTDKGKRRSNKEVYNIVHSLPTATFKYFDTEDYENLKRIENQIHIDLASCESDNSVNNSIKEGFDLIIKWLDVK